MANRLYNKQVSPKGYKKGGKVKKKETGVIEFRTGKKFKKVGPVQKVDILGKDRVKKMGGGMSTARKDMRSGYYKDDMGMKGGKMYKEGGKVGKKKQGYKDRKDESIAMRIRKKRTARQLKASRDDSYGKFGSKSKKSGKINR
jgi:hypothetical protein